VYVPISRAASTRTPRTNDPRPRGGEERPNGDAERVCDSSQRSDGQILSPRFHALEVTHGHLDPLGQLLLSKIATSTKLGDSAAHVAQDTASVGLSHPPRGAAIVSALTRCFRFVLT
jgi:hypothetical protein